MRILITAFYDDNFGDMLIRTCFTQLLRVALEDLEAKECELDFMSLKEPDCDKIRNADIIYFSGGAIFGINYLKSLDYIEKILDIAEEKMIPVVFSSCGLNNSEKELYDEGRLITFLQRPCIKAISVRDDIAAFKYYANNAAYEIVPVCDPAVWAGHVYGKDIVDMEKQDSRPAVGINFVRGGLFKANDTEWNYEQESALLSELAARLEQDGIDCTFFTNGSAMDCAELLRFVNDHEIPPSKYVLCDTSRELVGTIARFDAVVATRMHSSIVSYALDVPSLNLVWNPKIPFFYENIGYPDRALMPCDWSVDLITGKTNELIRDEVYAKDPEYLMTLYFFIRDTLKDIMQMGTKDVSFGYEEVCKRLAAMEIPHEEDIRDMQFKLLRSENQYNKLKSSKAALRSELKDEIREQKKELKALRKEVEKLSKKNEKLSEKNSKLKEERNALKRRLDRIDNKAVVKLYHKVKGITR